MGARVRRGEGWDAKKNKTKVSDSPGDSSGIMRVIDQDGGVGQLGVVVGWHRADGSVECQAEKKRQAIQKLPRASVVVLWDTWRFWDGPSSKGKVFHYSIASSKMSAPQLERTP